MRMEVQEPPSVWTKTTRSNIERYTSELLVDSLKRTVRHSTKCLLISLFKKGNTQEKKYLMSKIIEKIPNIHSEGKASKEILEFIAEIIKLQNPIITPQSISVLELIVSKMAGTFEKWLNSSEADYFNFCENILDNKGNFKPYLYELNGCTKCYGQVENETVCSVKGLDDIVEEVKYKSNKIMFTFKRVYQISDFIGKIGMRENQRAHSVVVYTRDKATGALTKKATLNPLTSLEFTTDFLQFQIEGVKLGRCLNCGKNDESSIHCQGCRKSMDFTFKYRAVGGDSKKIMKESGEVYKQLSAVGKKFHSFHQSITNKKTIKSQLPDILEVEKIYKKVMLNLSVMKLPENKLAPQQTLLPNVWLCHSCTYYQITNSLSFLLDDQLLNIIYSIDSNLVSKIHDFLLSIYKPQKLSCSIGSQIQKILGLIKQIVYKHTKSPESINLNSNHPSETFNIFRHFFTSLKESESTELKQLVLLYNNSHTLSPLQKLTLILILQICKQDLSLLKDNSATTEKYNSVVKGEVESVNSSISEIGFDISSILKMEASHEVILFLKLLPNQLVPLSNNQQVHESIIPYIQHKLPEIPKLLPIVYSPYPIISLNYLNNLPAISEKLTADECSKLLEELFKFKDFWNFNLYSTLESCNNLISKEDTQKQFLIYLKGLSVIDDDYFLSKISSFLIPKRTNFIIQVELPHEDINDFIKKYKQEVEYPIIKQKQIRTENLPGETMKDVYDWISGQMKEKMVFELLCEKKSIDDLSVPIEMVHKKLYPKVDGKPPVEILRVVYRLRGLFEGEGREDKLPPLGDDKLQECLSLAPQLTRVLTLNDGSTICGLDPLFKIFKNSRYRVELQQTRKSILKMFNIIYKNEAVRIKSIESNFVDTLIRETLASLASKNEEADKEKEILLEIVSKLIDQVNKLPSSAVRKQSVGGERKASEFIDVEDDKILETANKNIALLLEKITESQAQEKTADTNSLLKLLPISSKDAPEISEKLFAYLSPLQTYESKNKGKIEKLLTFMEAVPRAYCTFKNICYQKRFLPAVLSSLISLLSSSETITEEIIIENQEKLLLDLSILKFSLQSCESLQKKFLEMQGLPIIHKLSILSTQLTKITTLSQEILRNLTDHSLVIPELATAAENIVAAYLQQKRKKAQASKAARLQNERKKRDLAAQNAFKDVVVVIEEGQKYQNLKCVVCKAGYQSSSNVLGVYTFISKSQSLTMERWWIDPVKKIPGGSSVSFFTVIHFECHRNSQVYDNQMKVSEWDGAQKRNADSKCNSWVPIRGQSTPQQQYERSSRKYLDVMKGNGFWMAANDVKALLLKLGNQENLTRDSKGSLLSNCKLLCVLFFFASSLCKKSINQFKLSLEGVWYYNERAIENPEVLSTYLMFGMFVVNNSLFQESWKRLAFTHISKLASKHPDPSLAARPFLIVLGIIKEIYRLIHSKIDNKKDPSTLHLSIEEYISQNLNIIESFESVAETYRAVLLKKNTIQEFEEELFKA